MITLNHLLLGTQGQALFTEAKVFDAIGTDTRSDLSRKIFFALKGDQFDGHDFIAQAIDAGAAAIVSHRTPPATFSPVTWIHVDDTLHALQKLAQYWRAQWGGKLIGITGSNGKTTVKDFTHTLLSGTFTTLKNEGSFNNHWGLPLTLLQLHSGHQWGVVEMGMNHAGEISELVRISSPNVVAVTMVGTAHIEFFGTSQKIAEAKEEIYRDSDKGGVGVFNVQNVYTHKMLQQWGPKFSKCITFGDDSSRPSDTDFAKHSTDVFFKIQARNSRGLTVAGMIGGVQGHAETQVWGEQNVYNLMAASALALAAGVTPEQIWQRLPLCQMSWGRNQWVSLKSNATVLFDAYNANPESFSALFANIEDLKMSYSKIYGVLGEMRELGARSEEAHYELGIRAAHSPMDEVLFFGPSEAAFRRGFESQNTGKNLVTSVVYKEELAFKIKDMLDSKALVVIKGSRGAQLERVVVALDPLDFKNYSRSNG